MMSKRAAEGLAEFKEVNLFLRGMVPMIGFKSDKVYYDRLERFAGESKYPFKKMLFLPCRYYLIYCRADSFYYGIWTACFCWDIILIGCILGLVDYLNQ